MFVQIRHRLDALNILSNYNINNLTHNIYMFNGGLSIKELSGLNFKLDSTNHRSIFLWIWNMKA